MTQSKRIDFLPRGLSRTQAATYVGVSITLFDQMVADGRMPPPREINSRRVWDRHQVDASFDELPGGVDWVRSPLEQWTNQRQADAEALAELTELSKTPGAVVYYRGYVMDRETFRQTVLSRPLGKLARNALQALYDRRGGDDPGKDIRGAGGTTQQELEAWGYVEVTMKGDRFMSWRITDAGIAAVEQAFAKGN